MRVEWEEVLPGLTIVEVTNGSREIFIHGSPEYIAAEDKRRWARAAKLRVEIEARTAARRLVSSTNGRDA